MKYYIEIDEKQLDRFRIDPPFRTSHGNDILVLKDKNNKTIAFELLKRHPQAKQYDCSCHMDYPNEKYKRTNGKWKCVDCYEFVEVSKHGLIHCRRKENQNEQ